MHRAADNKQVTVPIGLDWGLIQSTPRDPASSATVRVWRDQHTRYPGSVRIWKAGPISSNWASISHWSLGLTSASIRASSWHHCCLQSTAVQWLMSLPAMEYSTTSMQIICSSVLPYTPTTHPTDCPFLPPVLLRSNSGTCRMDCSWTRTSRKHWSSALQISCTPLLLRDVDICGWRRSVGGQWHEGSRCHAQPSSDIPETLHGGSTIVQLSFAGNPPYMPSTVYRTHGDTGLQSHTDQTGLLQLSAVWCYSQQHSGSATSAKQCSPGSKTISCPAITAWAALVTHSTQNQVQGICFQESQQRHSTDTPQSSHQGSSQWTDTSLVCRPTTWQAICQDRLCEMSLLLFCANCHCLRQ